MRYKAELTDLKADTSYQFRVSDDNGAGEWHPICTDGKNSFQMLVFPDSQSSTYDDWENVAPQPETDNYLTMDFSENTIAVRCYLPDGTLLDETVLQK